jgi:hypothetical protein
MKLSTFFLHLKFDALDMKFISETNESNGFNKTQIKNTEENHNCNKMVNTASNFHNDNNIYPYYKANLIFMKTYFSTFLISIILTCLFSSSANAQASLAGKGNLKEDSLNTFISFSPVHLDGKTFVRWLVKNDKKDGIFVVERSADGTDFEALGFRDRVGTELTVNLFYSFVDEEPLPGTSLYRVMQVGADNTYKYSSVVKVKNEKSPNRGTSSATNNKENK